jgi:hypothetical protein
LLYFSLQNANEFRRKETLPQLFRITTLSLRLTLLSLTTNPIETTHQNALQKWKATLDFLKLVQAFISYPPPSVATPRVFQGVPLEKPPAANAFALLRLTLYAYLAVPPVFTGLARVAKAFSPGEVQDGLRHASLGIMSTVTDLAMGIFRGYKSLSHIHKFRERLRSGDANVDLDSNLRQVSGTIVALARFVYAQTVEMIRSEVHASVLPVAQLQMTTTLLRNLAVELGPLDVTEKGDGQMEGVTIGLVPTMSANSLAEMQLAAMQMASRLVFEAICANTGRYDVFDWGVNWFQRQIELDTSRRDDPDSVGHPGWS